MTANLSLLFGRKYAKGQVISNFGTITFDTILNEDHIYTSTATQYPTEFGTIVSDHIIKHPDILQLSGMVSDTPLNILAVFNRSVSVFNQLVELHARRIVLDSVISGIKVYKNMTITRLEVPRNIKTGQTLTFNIEFQRILYDDDVQRQLNAGDIFEGRQDQIPRNLIAENTNIPEIQNDPAFSLKDQAEYPINAGVQSLANVPPAMMSQVDFSAALIAST
jgi:hypothetical protein